MTDDEDMEEEAVAEEEAEEEPPPPPTQPAPRARTKAPSSQYKRVRLKDVDFVELQRARARVFYRFLMGIVLVIFGIICLIRFSVYQYPVPWKATDPASARFNPAAFRFMDYQTSAALDAAIRRLLPPGTPRPLVDRLLGRVGKAHLVPLPSPKNAKPGETDYSYIYQENHNLAADVLSYFSVSHDNVRRWIIIVTYGPGETVVKTSSVIDYVQAIADNYTNIAPQRTDAEYWQ